MTTPIQTLIGVCREAAKADRIAARLRRAGRTALGLGTVGREPLIGRADYDPFQFVPPAQRGWLSRREAHRRALVGAVDRRAALGMS